VIPGPDDEVGYPVDDIVVSEVPLHRETSVVRAMGLECLSVVVHSKNHLETGCLQTKAEPTRTAEQVGRERAVECRSQREQLVLVLAGKLVRVEPDKRAADQLHPIGTPAGGGHNPTFTSRRLADVTGPDAGSASQSHPRCTLTTGRSPLPKRPTRSKRCRLS
jgi:hypothetical protein